MDAQSHERALAPKQIIVASKNSVKVAAAMEGFRRMYPENLYAAHGISVPSGVPEQPFTDSETLLGAMNRAQNARSKEPNADYWIGIEGGIAIENPDSLPGQSASSMQSFAWVVIINSDGRIGRARTATFYQPEEVAKLVRGGMELGHADDVVFGKVNSKQVNGSVGLLTGDVIGREQYYEQAVILALIPFKNAGLTF
jgi:inosine/xanthosine triphosphatase